ncbi:hypothetical protein VM94_04682 [Janthinobacterium sp. KBS0711]|nr:hypothetical protein VM94_04682 [Janthinobacterium sp. KBS0711]
MVSLVKRLAGWPPDCVTRSVPSSPTSLKLSVNAYTGRTPTEVQVEEPVAFDSSFCHRATNSMPKLAIGWIAMSLKMRVRFTSEPKPVSPDAPNCAPLPVPGPTPYCTPKVLPPPNTLP